MDETFSHRNVWTVCNIQMLRMLHDVWLFFFFFSRRAIISLFELHSLCYKTLTLRLYFMIGHSSKSITGENVKFLQKVLSKWMSFSTSVHLFHSWLSAIWPHCCTILIHTAPGTYTNVTPHVKYVRRTQTLVQFQSYSSESQLIQLQLEI